MDIVAIAFTWGVPLLVLYLLLQSKKELVRLGIVFKRLALDNRGTVDRRTWLDYPRLTVQEKGFSFCLGVALATGGDVWTTRLNMAHRQTLDFTLRLQPQSRLEKLAEAVGFPNAAVGQPGFNEAFLVKTRDAQKAGRFVSAEVQEGLLKLKHLSPELAVTRSAIVLTASFTDRAADLRSLVHFGKLLCRRLHSMPRL